MKEIIGLQRPLGKRALSPPQQVAPPDDTGSKTFSLRISAIISPPLGLALVIIAQFIPKVTRVHRVLIMRTASNCVIYPGPQPGSLGFSST